MIRSSNLKRLQNQFAYYIWVGVFFVVVAGIVGTIYVATRQIEYVWRWYRIPQYFVYQEDVEIRAENAGEVIAVTIAGKDATIRVKGKDETKDYLVSTKDIRVNEKDLISPGDILSSYKQWRPGILAQGMALTLKVSIYAIFCGIIIGTLGGVARISANPALRWFAMTYVEFIRGSPLLVQIFIWYFVIGTMVNQLLAKHGIEQISPLGYGVAAMSCFVGAYVTEVVRAGIQSIHRGQIEAARSLGMNYPQAMRHIILPQAMRRILPPLAGEFIALIKDSSLLGIIAVRELTKATREAITTSLQPFELFFTCAALYLVLTCTLSAFVRYLERRNPLS